MLRHDLAAAGIEYRDESGRVFDFHALRHQFISMLAAAGVHPKTAQELARHSDINLTMSRYTHVRLSDLSTAVHALPNLHIPEMQKATGTLEPKPSNLVTLQVTHIPDKRGNSVRTIETTPAEKQGESEAAGEDEETAFLMRSDLDCDVLRKDNCERQDLNLHPLRDWILNPARLPVSPLSRDRINHAEY